MQTDIEKLLQPRYKVINNYPDNVQAVGTIIEVAKDDIDAELFYNWYPAIFRKLNWYEDRTPEEMPMYVKNKKSVFKVPKWIYRDKSWHFVNENPHVGIGIETYNLEPATEQDHINYIKLKLYEYEKDKMQGLG